MRTNEKRNNYLTNEEFDKIFPYAAVSNIFTDDNSVFWSYDSFINSIKWLNSHKDKRLHNFGVNRFELAVFLAQTVQEIGDSSLIIPYPWDPTMKKGVGPEFNSKGAGGLTCIMEGSGAIIEVTKDKTKICAPLNDRCRLMIGLHDDQEILSKISNQQGVNQPGFGLGSGTGGGAVFQDGLVAVSDDGTLYGNNSYSTNVMDVVLPTSELRTSITDRRYAALGSYAQYGGKGAIQLSYNFNYCYISLELFSDYRLARYPNLLVTHNRDTWNGIPEYMGFAGKNVGGKNKLPLYISNTTPPAKMMGWISAIVFWMLPRSGREISCHECMLEPYIYGITSVNLIVNNQSGCTPSWAADKIVYYKRICNILNINYDGTIICPANIS